MSFSGEEFELPPSMLEATPNDVQGILDAIDLLLIDNGSNATTANIPNVLTTNDDTPESDLARRILVDTAKRMHLSPEQLLEKLSDMQLYDLVPVDDMETFQVRRFRESYQGTIGMVVRIYPDKEADVAHIHETPDGLRLDFDYDLPGARRANVADCEEIKRQLGMTSVIK